MFKKIISICTVALVLIFNAIPANGAGYYGHGYKYKSQYHGRYIMPSRLGSMYPHYYRRPAYNFYAPRRTYNRSGWGRQHVPRAVRVMRMPWYGPRNYNRFKQSKPVQKPFHKKPLMRKGPELQAYRYRAYHRTAYAPRWQMQGYRYYPRPVRRGYAPNYNYKRISKDMMANRLPIPRS